MSPFRTAVALLLLAAMSATATPPSPPSPADSAAPAPFLSKTEATNLFEQAVSRGLPRHQLLLVVDTALQRGALVSRRGTIREYPLSTSKFGTGNASGSNQTPLGWHKVQERFGADAAPGSVFVSRRATGRVVPPEGWRAPSPAEDLVLTRILWLVGLEPGVNSGRGIDSHERCIYIHGTNQEQLLGSPASHGCIRLSNADVVHLFDFTEGATLFCFIR